MVVAVAAEKRDQPNADDPLSEPTLGRRIWAGRLALAKRSGGDVGRKAFLALIDLSNSSLDDIEIGVSVPRADTLERISDALGYTIDELVKGKVGTPKVAPSEDVSPATLAELAAIGLRLASNPDDAALRAKHVELCASYVAASGYKVTREARRQ